MSILNIKYKKIFDTLQYIVCKKFSTIKIMYNVIICILRIVVLSFNIWQKQIIEFSKI